MVAATQSASSPSGAHPRRGAETLEQLALRERIDALGTWFHNLRLPCRVAGTRGVTAPGPDAYVETAPTHPLGDFPSNFWRFFCRALPEDLSGKAVLDIGCNAGFYAFEMQRRGASRVLGVDHDERYLQQARLARRQLGLGPRHVEFRRLEAYDLDRLGERFDLVLFMGVFYHLRHPLYALEKVVQRLRPGGLLLFQTMERGPSEIGQFCRDYPITERQVFYDERFPRMYFVEHSYAGDATNWWIPNPAAAMAMLRACGLEIADRPCREVYLCRRA
jgi:tRNA (mo5U34)-methyltransferase